MQKSVISCLIVFVSILFSFSLPAGEPDNKSIEEGKKLALEFCQACHTYQGTEQAGTVAPPLLGMKARFPDRATLYNIIYDPQRTLQPDTMMPPFGRNELLAKDQIEKVIDFLYTL